MARSWLFCFWIACSDCVWVRVAVCAIMSLVLIGLLGSWYFISATSSLRNMSLPIWSSRLTADVAVVVATEPVPVGALTGELIGKVPPFSHADVEAGGRRRAGRGQDRAALTEVCRAHP